MVATVALQILGGMFVWLSSGVLFVIYGWPRTGWTMLGMFVTFVCYCFWEARRVSPAAPAQETTR